MLPLFIPIFIYARACVYGVVGLTLFGEIGIIREIFAKFVCKIIAYETIISFIISYYISVIVLSYTLYAVGNTLF